MPRGAIKMRRLFSNKIGLSVFGVVRVDGLGSLRILFCMRRLDYPGFIN
jgi:hypothetical protein